ncbi:MAG: hypothetical protein KAQ75_09965 [Bacteroidales bacterium]|nr:hypothetical protein [Bacteroidales bacterium]
MKGIFLITSIIIFVSSDSIYNKTEKISILPDSNDWELSKENDGIKIYTRIKKDSKIKEFKAKIVISTSVGKLVQIIDDVKNYPNWMTNCEFSKTHKTLNDSTGINYMKTSIQWPLSDRDLVFEYRVLTNNSKYFEVIIKSVPNQMPVMEDIIRIIKAEGKFIFKEIEPGKIEITYQFFANPEGYLPAWIINLFIVEGPYHTLLNLQKLCS